MSKESNYFESTEFIGVIYVYRKVLGIVVILSFAVSAVISFLLPNKFESKAVIYPSNTNSIAKALMSSNVGNKSDIMEFGDEEKSEQMLEILNSQKVSSRIIEEFNLIKHYKISGSTPLTDLEKKFNRNITFKRNRNMAIEIEVLDENPDTAALIANRIVQVLDEVTNDIQKKRALQGFEIVKKAYLDKQNEIKMLEDSLSAIMKKGVINVKSQSEVYTQAYAKAITNGNQKEASQFAEKMNTLSEYGAQQISLKDLLENERLNLSDLKEKFDEAKVDSEGHIQNFFIVADAFPAEKKAYPIRWLIITLSTFGTFFIGVIVIVISNKIQKLKADIEVSKTQLN